MITNCLRKSTFTLFYSGKQSLFWKTEKNGMTSDYWQYHIAQKNKGFMEIS
jgi:hypothetical protein